MEKIPTLFERGDDFKVTDRVRSGCEWVLDGEGVATEKLDGSNVRLTVRSGLIVRLEKRRNPSKVQKKAGIVDGWYADTDDRVPEDKWLVEAAHNTTIGSWSDGEHCCEAIGPKIQGNPLGLGKHICVRFDLLAKGVAFYEDVPRDFDALREMVTTLKSKCAFGMFAEGIVFHHPDGRMAKIKRVDFAST